MIKTKKKEALAVLKSHIVDGKIDVETMALRSEAESEIRKLADKDDGFEDAVFELGCSVLAKAYLKEKHN